MSNMVVRTNIFALNAHRNMKNVGAEQQRASNRLASGFRINSAADDAAGLAISESMRSQIRGLDQASRNAQDGQALINTAEGGMQEIQNMLQRIRELTVQAANDTNIPLNRAQIQLEIDNLLEEVDGMASRVEFNSHRLLTGNFSDVQRRIVVTPGQTDARANSRWITAANNATEVNNFIAGTFNAIVDNGRDLSADFTDWASFKVLGTAAGIAANNPAVANFTVNANDINDLTAGGNVTWDIIIGGDIVASFTKSFGDLTGVNATHADVETEMTTWVAGRTNAQRADLMQQLGFVDGGTHVTFNDTLGWQPPGRDLFFQIGANSDQGIEVGIADMRVMNIFGNNLDGLGSSGERTLRMLQSIGTHLNDRAQDISSIINGVQRAIDFVSNQRADLGAVSNRLDFTTRSLDISSENLSDAESRVRNTDMAREMMRFTMSNVLQQAAVSMLAQANQLPNNLLQLLR